MSKKITKAMVMSAGMGSRLEPLTLQVPKPLVPVCNRPVMDILFESLAQIGIKDVICNTYYLAEQIIKRYQNQSFGINFNYIKEETLSGTAGGVKKCQFFFDKDEDFVVFSADGLTNADIRHGIEIHQKSGAVATIGVKQIKKEEVSHFGVVVTDTNGYITEFQEKPSVLEAKSNYINTGIYIFNSKIFDYIPADTFYDFAKNVFPQLLLEHQINTFVIDDYWSDIGTLDQYKQSVKDTFDGLCKFNHKPFVKTEKAAYICESDVKADFVGCSVVGKNCKFGKNVTIEDSIIWDNVEIADNVYVKNSIIISNEVVTQNIQNQVVGCDKTVNLTD